MDFYQELTQQLQVEPGEKLWISSELLGMIMSWRRLGVKLDTDALIDAFQAAVGPEGTLLFPVFTFEFSNHKYFDYRNTKGITGALGNAALRRPDFVRTQHPMHSFAVWGRDQQKLAAMDNRHSFGDDSPFGYCLTEHVRQIMLNTDYVHAMTFIHYAEAKYQVPYRFAKTFTGTYVDAQGNASQRSYDYAARYLEIEPEECFNRMGSILEQTGVARKYNFAGNNHISVDLAESMPTLRRDICENMCRNIYDFNIPREEIFK